MALFARRRSVGGERVLAALAEFPLEQAVSIRDLLEQVLFTNPGERALRNFALPFLLLTNSR